MEEKKPKKLVRTSKKAIFCLFTFLLIGGIIFCNFTYRVNSMSLYSSTQRGMILDKFGNPLAISVVRYKVFLIKSPTELDLPAYNLIKKYIKKPAEVNKNNLPFLLSSSISQEEIKKFKDMDGIVIEKIYQRKILYPFLTGLIGGTIENKGISGIEKVFDNKLRKGQNIYLPIDLDYEKNLKFMNLLPYPAKLEVWNKNKKLMGYFENKNFVKLRFYEDPEEKKKWNLFKKFIKENYQKKNENSTLRAMWFYDRDGKWLYFFAKRGDKLFYSEIYAWDNNTKKINRVKKILEKRLTSSEF